MQTKNWIWMVVVLVLAVIAVFIGTVAPIQTTTHAYPIISTSSTTNDNVAKDEDEPFAIQVKVEDNIGYYIIQRKGLFGIIKKEKIPMESTTITIYNEGTMRHNTVTDETTDVIPTIFIISSKRAIFTIEKNYELLLPEDYTIS